MMNRRKFLKTMGAAGASVFMPSAVNFTSMYRAANAVVDYAGVSVDPAVRVLPQVINVFLYGGPSELGGNLTNILDIENNSQNSYAAAFPGITEPLDPVTPGQHGITTNGFWGGTNGAGGEDMEFMLAQSHMSVYRTLFKVKDDTRSHRESVLMSQKGSLDIDFGAGVGTRIAAMMTQNRTMFENGSKSLADGTVLSNIDTDLLLPFVSFEGQSRIFSPDPDFQIPLLLRGTTLSQNLDNPYSRNNNANAIALDALVAKEMTAAKNTRYAGVVSGFSLREFLESKIGNLQAANALPLPLLVDAVDIANNDPVNNINTTFTYPNTSFGTTLQAAVTLAVENPSSLFISVGGNLGGWDDHNNGIDQYPDRMRSVMAALKAAAWQIKYSNGTTPGAINRTTDNIIINVYGDFGRRVNLNNSLGWDHGNNQNLFTIGGSGVTSAAFANTARILGRTVGTTVRVGSAGTNNQFTEPAPGSFQVEQMSVAATTYSYFGVQNPEIMTADPTLNPAGDPAIDESAT